MTVRRRSLTIAIVAMALMCLTIPHATATTRLRGSARIYANVDIDRIGYARLEALKVLPGLDWWVELDDQMLVCGEAQMLAGLASYRYRLIAERVDPANLGILYGAGSASAGVPILAKGGRSAIVLATPEQRERIEHAQKHADDDVPHAHGAVAPFVPNIALAHQAANDPIRTDKTAFDVSVQSLVDSVDGNRWYADIQTLGGWNRYSRNAGNITARDWLVQQFQAMPGLTVTTPSFNIPGSGGGTTSYNVVATLTGTTRPNDWYIVGAHFDSTSQSPNSSAPGCEDNGSGTAAVLEMARIFTAHPPDATVIFMCYSGEEQGLYGSTSHASGLVSSGDNAKIRAVLIMDMIGYTGDSDLDCLLETSSLGQSMINAYSAAAAQYTTLRIVTSLNPFGSDHVPYLNRGMPALLVIENDWDDYPNYHRTTDTINNITIDMGYQSIRMNVAALAQMTGTSPAGHGSDTIGVYNQQTSSFFLRNSNASGNADVVFSFGGGGGLVPLAGDWDGNGSDTIGLYNPTTGVFFLKNTTSGGSADVVFSFGSGGGGLVPIVGDWDGNGTDTVGLYNPTTSAFFLRNTNSPGNADVVFTYGPANVTPVVGDWDGNGSDTIGVFAGSTSTYFLRNSNSPGNADLAFSFGSAGSGWMPIVGDWNNDGLDTIGLYQPNAGNFFLRDANSAGAATTVFGYGPPSGVVPVQGDWNNQ